MVQRKVIVRGATDQALDELDVADIPDLTATYEAAGGIAIHAADTSSVHGITDTAVLATDAEVATAVSDHAALPNPHPGYLTPAEGDAAYDALGAAAAAAAASQPLDSDLTAIAALTTTAFGRSLLALADDAALGAAHTHSGGLTLTPLVQDLGAGRRSGTFDITGLSGLAADKPVLVTQTAAPIASKGDARDEMEFDAIQASGYVVDATTIRVYWNASGVVVGDYAFGYTVSG